ncbi:DUF5670 family protein [Chryseobacterium sp.]|uniref:DUF5670 family protein n=1 Tax=Chryseobacterium sp. TaxID=1871047 RepID=UPI00397760DA
MNARICSCLSVIFLLIWILGYIFFDLGGAIHYVFLVGILLLIFKFVKDYKSGSTNNK